jgi:3-oxoadipate enol-lactonase
MLLGGGGVRGKAAIDLDGRRLGWRSIGRGPALLLVNGYAATAADWDPAMLAGLAHFFEVICPDNRGVGDSTLGDPDELTIDSMAADLESLLDARGIERAPVLGWSMGGFVAQQLFARAPGRVESLVLLATDPGGPGAVLAEPRIWAQLTDCRGSPSEQASRLISLLFPPALAPEIDRQFGPLVAAARAELSERTLRAQELAIVAWHAQDPSEPRSPPPRVLLACGNEDVVIPPQNIPALEARWPGARSETFDGGGHAFMAQEPARLVSLIEDFLR